jgi:homoserine kinase
VKEPFSVRVPATIANLGPGFDCLGLALNIYNSASFKPATTTSIKIDGEGTGVLSAGKDNLLYQALARVFELSSLPVPDMEIECLNAVPLGRGLGSSAAAIVAGLIAANSILANKLSPVELLQVGVEIEGHPDNVVPALLGGCRIALNDGKSLVQQEIKLAGGCRFVLFIPDNGKSTAKVRQILAAQVSREDAVFNLGRVALLVNALITGNFADLRIATQDRLHQSQRLALFPVMRRIMTSAMEAGADGAFLAGSGPTVAALTTNKSDAIGEAMRAEANHSGIGGKVLAADLDTGGALLL